MLNFVAIAIELNHKNRCLIYNLIDLQNSTVQCTKYKLWMKI